MPKHVMLPMSHSRLGASVCIRRQYLEKVKRLQGARPYRPLEYGHAVHSAIEEGAKYLAEEMPLETAQLRAVGSVQNSDYIGYNELSATVNSALTELKVIVDELLDEDYDLYVENFFVVDSNWKPCEYHHGYFQGKIDFLAVSDDTIYVIDYKTDKRLREEEEIHDDLQLKRYLSLAMAKYPHATNFKAGIYFIRHSKLITVDFTKEELIDCKNHTLASIGHVIRNWPSRLPKGTPSFFCGSCTFAGTEHCKVELHPTVQIDDRESFMQAAGEFEYLKSLYSGYEKALKKHVDEHGDADSKKYSYRYYSTGINETDTSLLIDKLIATKQIKLLKKIVSIDKEKMKKYLKFLSKGTKSMVQEIVSPSIRTNFIIEKLPDEES